MRKMITIALVVLAMAVPANAQQYIPTSPDGWWYKVQGNQLMMLEADNLSLVNQIQRQGYRSLGPNLRWGGNAYGIPVGQGGFYPMYDRDRRPLSGRQRIERAGGVVAMADGARRIFNNPRGAAGWIEAVVGAVLVNDSRYRGNDKNVVVTPSPSESQQPVHWSNGAPVARPGGTSPFWGPGATNGRSNCMEQGMVTLENQSAGPLRVYRDTKPFEILLPKEQKCASLGGDYTGEIVGTVVGSDGLTGRVGVAPAKPESRPGLVLVWR